MATGAATAIGTALLTKTGGLTVAIACAALADLVGSAEATGTATAITTTLFVIALRFAAAAATTVLAFAHADLVPLNFAAEGVHGANTFFALATLATGIISG